MNSIQHYQDAHLDVDFGSKTARLDSVPIRLTRKEYELLAVMVLSAGELIPRRELLMRVWGYGPQIRTRTLDVHIRRLRRKLGCHSDRYIETIFGVGYRFQSYRYPEMYMPQAGRPLLALGA